MTAAMEEPEQVLEQNKESMKEDPQPKSNEAFGKT